MAEYNADAVQAEIGDLCTHCGRDTSLGSGLFVNRIPSGTDAKLVLTSGENDIEIQVDVNGYMCADCQSVECDQCGKLTLDYDIENSEIICSDCQDNSEQKEKGMAKEQQVTRVCGECGSEDVRLLAWNEWNIDQQRWVLSMDGGEEDSFWCIDCDSNIETPEKQIIG